MLSATLITNLRALLSRDPEQLGGHRLIGRLGEGGQGVVYLAETESGEHVAIKLLHARADSGTRSGFLREVASARKVASFCTARILDVGEDEYAAFLITEFIDGPSLREVVDRDGPLSGTSLFRLAIGTATALAAIHNAGVVHRDLKPGNVLLGPDGPRVIDFGIARSVDATLSATSSVLGTPSYMAPEQLAGEAVGQAADVFAWGATIAYAATGQAPYGQDTIPAVMHRIMTGKPDLGKLTGALHDLVAQCLRKEASRRPGSSEILLRLLEHSDGPISPSEALEQGRAVSAAHDEALADARTARWTTMQLSQADIPRENRHILKRRRALIAVSAVAVLAITAAGAVAVVTSPTSEKHQTRTSSISSSPSIDLARGDRRSSPTPTPDPTSPTEIAEYLDQAISARKTASITAEGGMDQSDDRLKANGRFFYRPGTSTNYDVTVYNPDMQGIVEDDIGRPVRVILVGNTGYPQQVGARPVPADSTSYEQTDRHVSLAMRTRWITSPYGLLALLRNASSLKRSSDQATHTFQGTASGAQLSSDGPVGAFYASYGGKYVTVKFTLVVSRDYLPKSLDLNLLTRSDGDPTFHSFYSATYRNWGQSGTITRPY